MSWRQTTAVSDTFLEPLEHQQDNNIWIIELTIKELTADDSGYFKCVLGNKASSDIYQLKVKVPISEVYFTVINKYGVEERINDTTKSIAQKSGEEGGVACHAVVTSGIVKPIIQMTNTGNMSFETITSSMPHEISSARVRYRTSKQMRFVSKRLDRSLNGRELHCEGWTSGFRAQKKAASLTLNIGFPPVLNCLPSTVYGNVGDTATVSCNVSANPDCRYLELSWGNVGTEKVVTAATSNVASPSIHLSSHESSAINSRIVNFTVTALEEHHFSKKYFLRCHNIYGNAEQQLTVIEGSAPWEISVGTTHLWSAALLMSALLTYTL
ncbi:hypothetical protein LSAT2_027846 [Lamellibrachia satsuma]|nr:hypothetical protein LSAT2_027846 [Lamellibrachia satsuma]